MLFWYVNRPLAASLVPNPRPEQREAPQRAVWLVPIELPAWTLPAEVYAKEEDLRTLRENVLLVVRDYNRILAALNTEERGLFKVCSSVD